MLNKQFHHHIGLGPCPFWLQFKKAIELLVGIWCKPKVRVDEEEIDKAEVMRKLNKY